MWTRPARTFLASVLALLAACAPAQQRTITALDRPADAGASAILLFPLDIELAEVAASGALQPRGAWTEAARANLDGAIASIQQERGLTLTRLDADALPTADRERLGPILRLSGAVSTAIAMHHGPALPLPAKQGKLLWSMGPAVAPIGRAAGGRYGLIVRIRDSYTSPERAAMMVAAALLRVHLQGGVQLGYATLVDLETGDIVWFNRLARTSGDLRTAEPARETAEALLRDIPR